MLKRYFAGLLVALAGLLAAPAAMAEDLAVIITNEFYDHYPRIRDGRSITDLDRDFQDAGFEVITVRNLNAALAEPAASDLWDRMNNADRLVVVLSGHFVRTGETNWLLAAKADHPSAFAVGNYGVPLTAMMDIAANKQGSAVIAVATDGTDIERGPGTLTAQFSRDIPQGVTFIHGIQSDVASFLANEVLQPGRVLAEAKRNAPRGLRVEGFLPGNQSFLPRGSRRNNTAADRAYWDRARSLNSLEAYQAYLDRYPSGLFVGDATARIRELRITPEEQARIDEQNLNLSLEQRRTIQRNLTLIGYDTRGIDGILGRRSREAIASWQSKSGMPSTGYLTANQISRIEIAAAARASELEAEAERRRLENERQDRQYWNQTGSRGAEAGLRQYLQRYPDGLFAKEARASLADYEREQRRLSDRAERDAWDRAATQGTLDAYQAYLNQYPQGRFAEEAQARVASLSRPETPPQIVQDAEREENSLNLNGLTRSLIEGQLNKLGFRPGAVDGRFDNDTRGALRRYQRDNGLPVTGYVTRAAIIRLLASAVQ